MTESIDNEILISLVEARPVLWDKTQEIYRDRNATRNAWREIYNILNPEFEKLEDKEKNNFGKEVSKRWTNLRDAFSKSRRKIKSVKKSGAGAPTVKKYVFNDQMQFLKKCYESREASESVEDTVVADNDKTEMSETQHGEQDDGGEVTNDIDVRAGKRMANTKRRKPDEEELAMLKALKQPEQDPDSHMSFFYSLIPHVKKFDPSELLQFQMSVLDSIFKINEKKTMSQPSAYPSYPQQNCLQVPITHSYPHPTMSLSQQPTMAFPAQHHPFTGYHPQQNYPHTPFHSFTNNTNQNVTLSCTNVQHTQYPEQNTKQVTTKNSSTSYASTPAQSPSEDFLADNTLSSTQSITSPFSDYSETIDFTK